MSFGKSGKFWEWMIGLVSLGFYGRIIVVILRLKVVKAQEKLD
jgi:hypothetical protein